MAQIETTTTKVDGHAIHSMTRPWRSDGAIVTIIPAALTDRVLDGDDLVASVNGWPQEPQWWKNPQTVALVEAAARGTFQDVGKRGQVILTGMRNSGAPATWIPDLAAHYRNLTARETSGNAGRQPVIADLAEDEIGSGTYVEGIWYQTFAEGLVHLLKKAADNGRAYTYYIPTGAGKTWLISWIRRNPLKDLMLAGDIEPNPGPSPCGGVAWARHPEPQPRDEQAQHSWLDRLLDLLAALMLGSALLYLLLMQCGDVEANPGPPMDKDAGDMVQNAIVAEIVNAGAQAAQGAAGAIAEHAAEVAAGLGAAAAVAYNALENMQAAWHSTPSAPPMTPEHIQPSAPPMTPPLSAAPGAPAPGPPPPPIQHLPVAALIPGAALLATTAAPGSKGGLTATLNQRGDVYFSAAPKDRRAAAGRMYGREAKCYLEDRIIMRDGECKRVTPGATLREGDHLVEWVNTPPPSEQTQRALIPLLTGQAGTIPAAEHDTVLVAVDLLRSIQTGVLSREASTGNYRIVIQKSQMTAFGPSIWPLLVRLANKLHLDVRNRAVFDLSISGDVELNPGPVYMGEYTGEINVQGKSALEALPMPASVTSPWSIAAMYHYALEQLRLNEDRLDLDAWVGTTVSHNRITQATDRLATSVPELFGVPVRIWCANNGVAATAMMDTNSIDNWNQTITGTQYFFANNYLEPVLRWTYSEEMTGRQISYHEGDKEDRVEGAIQRIQPTNFDLGSLRNGLTYPTLTYLFNVGRDLNISDSHYLNMTTPVRKLLNYALPYSTAYTRQNVSTVFSSFHAGLISNSPAGGAGVTAIGYQTAPTGGPFAALPFWREPAIVAAGAGPQIQIVQDINDATVAFATPGLGVTVIPIPWRDRDVVAMTVLGMMAYPVYPCIVTCGQTYVTYATRINAANHADSMFATWNTVAHCIEGITTNVVLVVGKNAALTGGPAAWGALAANAVLAPGALWFIHDYMGTFLNAAAWMYNLPVVARRWVVDQLGMGEDWTTGVCLALGDQVGYCNKADGNTDADWGSTSAYNQYVNTSQIWNLCHQTSNDASWYAPSFSWGGTRLQDTNVANTVPTNTSQTWSNAPNTTRAYSPRFSVYALSLALTGLAEWPKQDPKFANTIGGNVNPLITAHNRCLATSWDVLAQLYLKQPSFSYYQGNTYQNYFQLPFMRMAASAPNYVGSEHSLVGAQQHDILEQITGLRWPNDLSNVCLQTYRNMGAYMRYQTPASQNQWWVHCPLLLSDSTRWRVCKNIVLAATWPPQAGDRSIVTKSNPFFGSETATLRYLGHVFEPEGPTYSLVVGASPDQVINYNIDTGEEMAQKLLSLALWGSNGDPHGPCQLVGAEYQYVPGFPPNPVSNVVQGRRYRKTDWWSVNTPGVAGLLAYVEFDLEVSPLGPASIRSYGLSGAGTNTLIASTLSNGDNTFVVRDYFPSNTTMFAPIQHYMAGKVMAELSINFPAAKRLGADAIDVVHGKRGRTDDAPRPAAPNVAAPQVAAPPV